MKITQSPTPRAQPAKAPAAPKAPVPPVPPVRVPPLFRKIDWVTMAFTVVVIWVVYFLTLAPELTLQDSGELVTGSYYAGIPHPPGYPVWTIYSWLWTVLLPMGNIAWRVAVGQAVAGAIASGLLALMVSRGSSMLMEGIEELKAVTGKWENAICMVCGLVAGLLVGLDGFMWGESVVVNRIAVFSVPWFLAVLVCLMRWMYAPHQLRYAYLALFLFGVCITTHQSLLAAAIGLEVALAARNPRLGRDIFLGNFVVYVTYLVIVAAVGHHPIHNIGANAVINGTFHLVGVGSLIVAIVLAIRTGGLLTEWKPVLIMGALWVLGVSFYFYMPISGMTNPPMQWGYPRTVEGFFHALTRGQYEQPNPTNLLNDPGRFFGQLWMLVEGVAAEFSWVYIFIALVPFAFLGKLQKRERAWLVGLSAIYLCVGVLLIILLNPTPDRSSADLIKVFLTSSHTIVAALVGYGLALTAAYMATHYERFRRWGLLGGAVAAALALFCLWDAAGKQYFGPAGQIGLFELPRWIARAFAPNQSGLPIIGNLVLVAIAFAFVFALVACRQRAPLALALALFGAMPLYSALCHWADSEQRGHWFGYWFGHDMFSPPFKDKDGQPLFPKMTKDAVLYGGTDPGRFCPTYMVFVESFTPHDCQPAEDQQFDRRDVYIITQNALADGTYLMYIRAHYNKSDQVKYDTPFFQELLRGSKERTENYQTNLLAQAVRPLDRFFTALGDRVEKRRRTGSSYFTRKDFLNLPAFAAKLRKPDPPDPLAKYLHDNLTQETQALLAGGSSDARLGDALAKDLNRLLERELDVARQLAEKRGQLEALEGELSVVSPSARQLSKQDRLQKEIAALAKVGPLYETNRFQQVTLSDYVLKFIAENPRSHTRIRLNRLLLEEAYPQELARSLGGVYPDREMYIATADDSQRCFNEYLKDAERRAQHDQEKPREPKQLKFGEDVRIVTEGNQSRVQVSGQVAVMAINGLLTKVMFDRNPQNEFFVEESMPLDWMYPYLTPYGVIMKINRNPLPELSDEVCRRDHEFWSQYSQRLIGNWITYDTPVQQIADFVEKVYLRHDYNGFTGDRKFARDDDAQKAFSKLRSSIAGIYSWRWATARNAADQQRMYKEADFAFKQALAYCPFSPEAVFRYVQLLVNNNRVDDALLVTGTCLKLDPYNAQVFGLHQQLRGAKKQQESAMQNLSNLQQMETEVRTHSTNFQAAFNLAMTYLQAQQTNHAVAVLEQVVSHPQVDVMALLTVAQAYAQIGDVARLEPLLEKATKVAPEMPEVWYDLAALKAVLGRGAEGLPALRRALELSGKRLAAQPKARDLTAELARDGRFNAIRALPEFQQLSPGR